MAKRKGKKRVSATHEDEKRHDAVEDSLAPTNRLGRPRLRKTPRPSVELVEIDSGEEDREGPPHLRGVLRGLDPKLVIAPTHPSIKTAGDDDIEGQRGMQAVRHTTRQSRNGISEANYDMKFHPMDVVTRPKRAAKRGSTSTVPDEGAETEEESLPSSARGSDSSSDEHEDLLDNEDNLAPREPDPKATRHSKRDATSKIVNYSAKYHPQDYALPGYRHKARKLKHRPNASRRTLSHVEIPVIGTDEVIDLAKSDVEDTLQAYELADAKSATKQRQKRLKRETASPRKKLRTLDDDRGQGSSKKIRLQSTVTETGSDLIRLLYDLAKPEAQGSAAARASKYGPTADPISSEPETIALKGETSTSVFAAKRGTGHQMTVDREEPRENSDETEDDSSNDEEQLEEVHFTHSLAIRGSDESSMGMVHGDGSEDIISEMELPMFMNHHTNDVREQSIGRGSQEMNANVPASAFQQDMPRDTNNAVSESTDSTDLNHQTEHELQPSQFNEQFAVTEHISFNDENQLRSLRSSQRSRTDLVVESDPTTAEMDESCSEKQQLSSSH